MTADAEVATDSMSYVGSGDSRANALNDAVLGILAGQNAKDIEEAAVAAHQARLEAVRSRHGSERTRLAFRIKAIDDEIARVQASASALETERNSQLEHQRVFNVAGGQIRTLEAEIRAKRYELERERLRNELDRLQTQEHAAHEMLSAERRAEYEQELRFWQDTEQERARRIAYLERERERAERDTAAAEQKLQNIHDRHVTRTVSGFLLWVGYGSAAATGTVTAVLLSDKKDPSAPLADALRGLRAFMLTMSPAPSGPVAVILIGALLLATLAVLGAVIVLTDFIISRFDKQWRGPSGRTLRGSPLRPPDITRASYVQLLAAFPYVFVIGLVATVFAAGKASASSPDLMASLFPSLVNTFIGTVLALVSASVFLMYAVKRIESRADGESANWRRAWEFFVLPFVLIIALVTSTLSTVPSRHVWGSWAAFMLLSSVTLAYGVIYHGLFKDVDKLRWIARRFEDEIRNLTAPPMMPAPDRHETAQARAIAREFARERERLRLLDQQFSLKRILAADDSDDFALLDTWLQAYGSFGRWRRARSGVPQSYDSYRVLDMQAAPAEVARREELRAAAAERQALIADLQQSIDTKRALTNPARLDALMRERADVQAALESAVFEERRAIAEIEGAAATDLQQLRGAISLGITHKPAFDAVRTSTPIPTPPSPFVPIHEARP